MATPAVLPAVGATQPRRLTRYAGRGGFPLGAGAQALLGAPFAVTSGWLLSVARRQLAGERVPEAHAGPAVMMAISLVFGILGLWLLGGAVGDLARRARVARRRHRFPDQPWLADYPWEARGGRDLVPRELPRALALVAVVAAFAMIFGWAGFVAGQGFAFQLGGVLMIAGTIAAARRAGRVAWRGLRWGPSRLRFADFPCAPGGELEAIFDDLAPGVRGLPLVATLRCVQERWETRTDRRQERVTELAHWDLWRQVVEVAPGARSARFTLPAGAPGTVLGARPARWWELELVVARPRGDWRARFLVPVYASA